MSDSVAVLGAGIIGTSIARELASRGLDVTVLDRGGVGAGCSRGNAGWLTPCFSLPLPAPGVLTGSLVSRIIARYLGADTVAAVLIRRYLPADSAPESARLLPGIRDSMSDTLADTLSETLRDTTRVPIPRY